MVLVLKLGVVLVVWFFCDFAFWRSVGSFVVGAGTDAVGS